MRKLADRIELDGITADVSLTGTVNDDGIWPAGAHVWSVTLKRPSDAFATGEDTLSVTFHTGALVTKEPDAADVLECLLSDAAGYQAATSFEEWAEEYGFDTDSRKAEAAYNAVRAQTIALREFLGDEDGTYDEYLYDTERD